MSTRWTFVDDTTHENVVFFFGFFFLARVNGVGLDRLDGEEEKQKEKERERERVEALVFGAWGRSGGGRKFLRGIFFSTL